MGDLESAQQKLVEAKTYQKELKDNLVSIEALIKLLEHQGNSHPHYNQLEYLKERNKVITEQLFSLNEIENKLKRKISEND